MHIKVKSFAVITGVVIFLSCFAIILFAISNRSHQKGEEHSENTISLSNETLSADEISSTVSALVSPTPRQTEPGNAVKPKPTATVVVAKPVDTDSSVLNNILQDKIICIDPGHQAKGNLEMERVAPSGTAVKEKMSYGTSGTTTGVPEYRLNLAVGLKLKNVLQKQGAKVIMTRSVNEVDISNIQRAKMANDSKADIIVRIHADGAENPSARGVSVLYPGSQFVNDSDIIAKSKLAAADILKSVTEKTGASARGIVERNDLTGFNWSERPVILIEMGFMTNPDEDKKLNSSEYQDKIVNGIVEGLEKYFKTNTGK